MPDATESDDPASFDEVADELYATNPDDFVPARDDAVARAKEAGDKDLARAVARLRRPTKAAWLANLIARHRAEQLDGLLALAGDLADAQRTLDGATLRALSSQRSRLVAAMAREAGRLASQAGDSAGDSVIRDVSGILEAALADPGVAEEVRAGRLTRTVSYSGFGPAAEPGTVPARRPPPPPAGTRSVGSNGEPAGGRQGDGEQADREQAGGRQADQEQADQEQADQEQAERERAEQERLAREREERERALAEAEAVEARARDRQEADEAARVDAEQDHAAARSRVAELAAELEAARDGERAAAMTAREAAVTARESARVAAAAVTSTARARAQLIT